MLLVSIAGLALALATPVPVPAQQAFPSSWQIAWHQQIPFVTAQPQVADGLVRTFAGNDVQTFDLATGTSDWAVKPAPPQGQALLLGCCQTGAAPTDSGLYTLAGGNVVQALDPATGGVRWEQSVGEAVVAPPAVASSTVAVLALQGLDTVLYGLDSTSGTILWQAQTDRALPLLGAGGDTFFVSLSSGSTVAIGAGDGRQLWATVSAGRPALLSPDQISADLLVLPTDDGVAAVDRSTGIQRWAVSLSSVPLEPRVVGDSVYARTIEGTVVALDARDGSERWRSDVGQLGTRALRGPVGSRLFAAGPDGVVALDAATGSQLWARTPEAVSVAPLPTDDVVYVVADTGDLLVLDAASGVERARLPLGGGLTSVEPTLAPDGTLLVVTDGRSGSDLFAVRRGD